MYVWSCKWSIGRSDFDPTFLKKKKGLVENPYGTLRNDTA